MNKANGIKVFLSWAAHLILVARSLYLRVTIGTAKQLILSTIYPSNTFLHKDDKKRSDPLWKKPKNTPKKATKRISYRVLRIHHK